MTITRRKGIHSIHRFLVSFIPVPFVREIFEARFGTPSYSMEKVNQFVTSSSSHKETQEQYRTRECCLEPEDEENAHQIRRVISNVHTRTIEGVIQSLKCDQACIKIQLTSHLVGTLLQNFGDDWKSALGLFQWAGSQSGYKHTPYAYNKMVDFLGKMKQMDRMLELVHDMRSRGFVTLETIGKVMRRLTGARRWEDAIKMFDDIGSMGLEKDTESMNLLLDTLCKEKKVEVAREVFLELKAHIPPNAHTFNIFVHGWCNANKIDEAEWTILEMKGYGFQPSVITYSTILLAYCNQLKFRKVYEILENMEVEGCPPNVVTYTAIMHSLGKSQEVEEAMSIFKRMKSFGCKPDTIFYNSLINILGRTSRLNEASHVFEVDMPMTGVARNLSTYNTMISIFCRHSQEKNALNVLNEMENSSCNPDLQTYSPLLKLCFKTGKIGDNLKILLSDISHKHHLSLDLATYTLLIHGLCRADKFEWACLLFDEMVALDIPPKTRTCKLLMDEAADRSMYGILERVKSSMKHFGISFRKL